jgi:hypothetical protein
VTFLQTETERLAKADAEWTRMVAEKAERERRDAALAGIVAECTSGWLSQSTKCAGVDGLSGEEKARCQDACAAGGAAAYAAALQGARSLCASASTAPKCNVTRPATAFVPDVQLKSDLATCAQQCRDDRRVAAEAAAQAAAQAASEARAARGSSGSHLGGRGLWCVYEDGSRTCVCRPHTSGVCFTDATNISLGMGQAMVARSGSCSPCTEE